MKTRIRNVLFLILLFSSCLFLLSCFLHHQAPVGALDIPFYRNSGNRCMQTAMKCVIKYYLGTDVSLEELDRMTGRSGDEWTMTKQAVPVLYDLGLRVEYYCFSRGNKPPKFYMNAYNFDVNLEALAEASRKADGLTHRRRLSFSEIKGHISQGHAVIMLVDEYVLCYGEHVPDSYLGHFVIITGVEGESVYYHDSSSYFGAHMKVSKERLIKAWDAEPTYNNAIIVYGKRERS
jgi:hypothetical protein